MYQAKKPSVGDLIGDGLDALEGMIRVGYIIEHEHDAGDNLNNKGYHGNKAQCAKNIGPLWSPV
jgi:hypothetical protein